MEKQRLTLENVQEIGLDLLKKENYNSNEFQIYWGYNDEIVPDDMEEIREIKDKIGTEHLSDAVAEFLMERNSMSDYSEELVESVLKKYCDYNENSEEYQNLKEELDNIVFDEFTFDVNEMDLLRNSYGDVQIILCNDKNDKHTKVYDEEFLIESYKKPDLLKEELYKEIFNPTAFSIENQFNPMVFLIQSQGYEVEDLYNKEKIESSPFLTSLKNAIDNAYENEYASISFMKENLNLVELFELEETKQNIKIPKETMKNTEIVLEKDIVIDNKHFKIVSDYSEEKEETNLIGSFISNKAKIELTDEKGFETKDYNIEKIYEKAILDLDKEELEEFLESEKLPTFDEFIENKIVSDIREKYLTEKEEDLFFNKSTPKNLAESLINNREIANNNGSIISPEIDKALFERYSKEEDFGEAKTLREVMLEKYEEKIKDNILNIEYKVRNTSLLLEEYEVDENNLTVGDIKTLGNFLSDERIFTNKEILEDIRFEKGLAPTFDKEKIDEKTVENLKEVFRDWKKLKEESFESFNEFLSVSSYKIKDEVFKEEFSYYKDDEIDKDLFKELNIAYNKEYKLEDDLKKIEEKNKLLDTDKLEKINKEVKEMLGDVITFMEDSGHIEKQGNNYAFKDDILDKNNFRDMMSEFIPNEFEFKEDMLLKNLSRSELIERYDITTPNFEIYTKNGDEIFYSYVNDYSDIDDIKGKLEKFIIETKGQEFWDNMDYYNINDWDNLLKSGEVIGVSINEVEENQFTSVDEYLSPIFDNGEIFDYISDEIKTYGEDLRQELVSKVEDNVIDEYEYEKIKEKYEVEKKDVKTKEKGQEKEVTKDEFERDF